MSSSVDHAIKVFVSLAKTSHSGRYKSALGAANQIYPLLIFTVVFILTLLASELHRVNLDGILPRTFPASCEQTC